MHYLRSLTISNLPTKETKMRTIIFIVEVEVEENNLMSTSKAEQFLESMEDLIAKEGFTIFDQRIEEGDF